MGNRPNCSCCTPMETLFPRVQVPATDAAMLAYLDRLPRAQWSAADVLLYVNFPIDRERSKRVATQWVSTLGDCDAACKVRERGFT